MQYTKQGIDDVISLATQFRAAIEKCLKSKEPAFISNRWLVDFPHGSCQICSYLLAEYLLSFGVDTITVSTSREDWTHMWLVLNDDRVVTPSPFNGSEFESYLSLINRYDPNNQMTEKNKAAYRAEHLRYGIIVDITPDQFRNIFNYDGPSVYVGECNSFFSKFDFRNAMPFERLPDDLSLLYTIIIECLSRQRDAGVLNHELH